jgi:hypothetical protein
MATSHELAMRGEFAQFYALGDASTKADYFRRRF